MSEPGPPVLDGSLRAGATPQNKPWRQRLGVVVLAALAGAILIRTYGNLSYTPADAIFFFGSFVCAFGICALLALLNLRRGARAMLAVAAANLLIIVGGGVILLVELHPASACEWTCKFMPFPRFWAPDLVLMVILIFHARGLIKPPQRAWLLFVHQRHLALWASALWLVGTYMQPPYDYLACMAQSGSWQEGWEGYCLITYADGGKICSNSSDCQSNACLIPGHVYPMPDGSPASGLTGQCRKTNSLPWGCWTFIDEGQEIFWTCLDG